MTTWISKTTAAVMAFGGLTACTDLGALASLGGVTADKAPVALSQSMMAGKAFTLVPPQGYCIDQQSLKQRFALMARCDTLGAPNAAAGAAIGLLTVSVTPVGDDGIPTPEQTAAALNLDRIAATVTNGSAVTFRAESAAPPANLDPKHWRGTVQIGDQVLSLALFGSKDGRAVSSEGREMLNDLVRRSIAASS